MTVEVKSLKWIFYTKIKVFKELLPALRGKKMGRLGMYTFNQEAKAGLSLWDRGQPDLHKEFQVTKATGKTLSQKKNKDSQNSISLILWFENEMSCIGSCVWPRGSHMVVLCMEVWETLGGGALLRK